MAESILADDGVRPSRWPASWFGRLGEAFAAEQSRWLLWLPVAWGCGIVAYFELPAEPPLWLGATVAAAAGSTLFGLGGRAAPVALQVLLAAVLAAALGFALSQLRTALAAAPMLQRQVGPVRVEGRVVAQDALPAGIRVVLSDLTIERLDASATPG